MNYSRFEGKCAVMSITFVGSVIQFVGSLEEYRASLWTNERNYVNKIVSIFFHMYT